MDDSTMKLGLLLESAQAHQTLAESVLEKLKAHVLDLEGVAREEIRHTLLEELHAVGEDARHATDALRALRHAADLRVVLWTLAMAALSCAVPAAVAHWILPTRDEIAALSVRRDELTASVTRLTREGGRVELRRCGSEQRLCVRVDRKAPAYGEAGDFLVVKGY
ncbi:MAG: hypothetical protein WAN26_04655 [Steroidobacteraceae bacterium]